MTDAGAPKLVLRHGGQQVAALCWRRAPLLEILLITSLRTRRWILPKGWPEPGLTLAQSAAREALEEAGVTGEVSSDPIGHYHYLKEKSGQALPCDVAIFPLKVIHQRRTWPEKGAREIVWLPADVAATRLAEPALKRLVLHFRKSRLAA